ncbi:GNAT family N-acetyltransferase [Candidatus Bathyarchaeota archaeon]|nr:GNAT family N-acetyltransferase [Candidatus Bathyarchaeota archaeon]
MIISTGSRVTLRDYTDGDRGHYVSWIRGDGLWKRYDAPWEPMEGLLDRFPGFLDEQADPRVRAVIEVEGRPVGWVSRYGEESHPDTCYVGIDICVDECLGKGVGYEALGLWVDYLFGHGFHRVALKTYSFNPAIQRLALKLGFRFEGEEREVHLWEGEWVSRLVYGVLSDEWRCPKLRHEA